MGGESSVDLGKLVQEEALSSKTEQRLGWNEGNQPVGTVC